MPPAADSKNHVTARQTDLDGNLTRGHLAQQRFGAVFVYDVGPVSNAQGMTARDRFANVEAHSIRWHQPLGQFARVKRDLHFGIELVEEVDHLHVKPEVAHRY